MDELPMEIIVHIFQYLSKKEQIKVSEVSKRFREALFSPTLWTEHEKRIKVPASRMNSFRKFLKQTPWLKCLNLLVRETIKSHSTVHFTSVFRSLNNLECLSLQLQDCKPRMTFFPSTLKHISLLSYGDINSFITGSVLKRIAYSCPQLEHIQISYGGAFYTNAGLSTLLKMVREPLQTLILDLPSYKNPANSFVHCPPNLTTLCLNLNLMECIYCNYPVKLPNLKKLQILSLADANRCQYSDPRVFFTIFEDCSLNNLRFFHLTNCFPFCRKEFFTKFTKLPNFEVLYLNKCNVPIDVLVRFVRGCSSLKVLALKELKGYTKEEIFELEKLKKETPAKIYLSSTSDETLKELYFFPTFPNEYFDCLTTFNHNIVDEILHQNTPSLFKCHAPVIKHFKALISM